MDGEANGSEEAEAVLGKAGERISDSPNDFGGKIGLAADIIEELLFERIVKHAVDGEVASLGVFLRGGEGDGGRAPSVEVGTVEAEGGDFENVFVPTQANDTEGFALRIGSCGEEGLHLIGRGGGGNIDIGVGALPEGIADTAASVDGDVAGLDELLHNFFGVRMEDHFLGRGERRVR